MNLTEARMAKARAVAGLMRAEAMTPAPILIPANSEAEADAIIDEMVGKKLAKRADLDTDGAVKTYRTGVKLLEASDTGGVITLDGAGAYNDFAAAWALPSMVGQFTVAMHHTDIPMRSDHLGDLLNAVAALRLNSDRAIMKKGKPKKTSYSLLFSVGIGEVAEDNFKTVLTVFTPYSVKTPVPANLQKFLKRIDKLGSVRHCASQRLSARRSRHNAEAPSKYRPGMSISPNENESSIGCFVERTDREDRPLILGSGHGLSDYGRASTGAKLYCAALKRENAHHRPIATLAENGFIASNHATQLFDCALASLEEGVPFQNSLWGDLNLRGVRANLPKAKEEVRVLGCRTDDKNVARVTETEVEVDVRGRNGCTYHYINQIAFEGETQSASRNGDSGGLVTDGRGWALGLICTASHTRGGEFGTGLSHATPLQPLLNRLRVKLHTGEGPDAHA